MCQTGTMLWPTLVTYSLGDALQIQCSHHIVVQGPGSFPTPVSFCTTTVLEQSSPISHFCLFFSYKMPKIPFVRGLQPTGYITECFRLFRVVVEGPKGCFSLVELFREATTSAGELETSKLDQIFAYGKCHYMARPICMDQGSKRVILHKGVPFGVRTMFP